MLHLRESAGPKQALLDCNSSLSFKWLFLEEIINTLEVSFSLRRLEQDSSGFFGAVQVHQRRNPTPDGKDPVPGVRDCHHEGRDDCREVENLGKSCDV